MLSLIRIQLILSPFDVNSIKQSVDSEHILSTNYFSVNKFEILWDLVD